MYYKILEDAEEGYANLHLIDLLEHMDDTYGAITPDDLEENENNMNAPWSPEQPRRPLQPSAQSPSLRSAPRPHQ